MRFRSDTELAIWLWRHLAPTFESRALVLLKNTHLAEKIEQITQQSNGWRFDETSISKNFESLPEARLDQIRKWFKSETITVGGERENGWIDEVFGLTIVTEEAPEKCPEDLAQLVDMMTCFLIGSIDLNDSFATTRILSVLCPEVLPSLRRMCSVQRLSLPNVLESCTALSSIRGNEGIEPVLVVNIDLLKGYSEATQRAHEALHSVPNMKVGAQSAVAVYANFLLSLPRYSCNSKIRLAQKYISREIAELEDNFQQLRKIAPFKDQKAPAFIQPQERLLRFVVDRLTLMDITVNVMAMNISPAFKTPQVKDKPQDDVNNDGETVCVTPVAEKKELPHVAKFINNGTPTPVRSVAVSLFDEQDSGIYDDLIDEEKENLNPDGKMKSLDENLSPLKQLSALIPVRPKSKGLSVRGNGDNRGTTKRVSGKEAGNPNKKKPLAANQQSIKSFFNRA